MADEVKSSNTSFFTSYLEGQILDYARASIVIAPNVRQIDLSGKAGKVAQLGKWASISASALTEGTDLSNTAYTPTSVNITASEKGVMITVTDLSDASTTIADLNDYGQQLGYAIGQKVDTDLAALFASLNGGTAKGSSGVNLTLQNFLDALTELDSDNAPGQKVAVFHPVQWGDLRAQIATSTGAPFSVGVGDEISKTGYVGTLFGVNIYQSSLCPTANSAADRVGAMFVKDAIALATKWGARVELERDASLRATEIVATACYGVGEVADSYGVPIVTDA